MAGISGKLRLIEAATDPIYYKSLFSMAVSINCIHKEDLYPQYL
jgi:hypothetical protein